MHPVPDIFIAAAITSVLSITIIGGLLFYRAPKDERIFLLLLITIMLPMNALAYYFLRIPIDSLLSTIIGRDNQIYHFLRIFYAPLTEEPAKLWPLLVPLIYKHINTNNIVRVAIAIGLGFGIGEAWNVAVLLSKSHAIAGYPWYMFTGYINERLLVCIGHAAFVASALHFIINRKSVLIGISLGMFLHLIGNSPIYLANIHAFNFDNTTWTIILQIWVLAYLLAMGSILAFMAYGKQWAEKIFRGTMKCPECGSIYRRPIFGVNLIHRRYERCPLCKHWHMTSAFNYEEKINNSNQTSN
jgi:hypothetical protein